MRDGLATESVVKRAAELAVTLTVLLAGACTSVPRAPEIVAYYAGWKPDTVVAAGDATVINYAFAYVAADGALVLDGPPHEAATLRRLAALKDSNPNLRLMVSV